jgi:hypothetical protein
VGFWKLTMEVFGLELWDLKVGCIGMMEKPSWTLKVKRVRIMCVVDFKSFSLELVVYRLPERIFEEIPV